ncbi:MULTISPECIES: butyrate kinase [Pseudothermotoga]|uniref:butyrate kinase n=1 Tax=Pseudothermotoga TaxID=1643951 RepID=UPI00040EAA7E|nr:MULTISPECIES: butyrate kinase [Pseudothermotoga]HBJ81401.1 butyrate kinase [Pseudothermotoga sp.]
MYRILVINPGSTSTKIAVYEDKKCKLLEKVEHSLSDLEKHPNLMDQLNFRRENILMILKKHGFKMEDFDAIAARGGILPPLKSGTYIVDNRMIHYLKYDSPVSHVSNLAAIIGYELGQGKIPVYVTDPISVDEMVDEARFSGVPEIERKSFSHALNIKAVCRKVALELNADYEDLNFVVAHLGGGISVAAIRKGKIIDVNNANDEGPFSPERTGELPVGDVVRMCFSGKYTKQELKKKFVGKGGLVAYLGTNDLREALQLAKTDEKANVVVQAMAYQIGKEIGGMCAVLCGKVNAIVLTGGMAHSNEFVEMIKSYVYRFAPIFVVPGEFEMEALAFGALRVLRGYEQAKEWGVVDEQVS